MAARVCDGDRKASNCWHGLSQPARDTLISDRSYLFSATAFSCSYSSKLRAIVVSNSVPTSPDLLILIVAILIQHSIGC
jgi:hypothetical protein